MTARFALLAPLLGLLVASVRADSDFTPPPRTRSQPTNLALFNFTRGEYDSEGGLGEAYYGYEGRIYERWETDYPEGDENFTRRLAQLSRITVNPVSGKRTFDAPDLGDFPFLFVTDPGWMVLSDAEEAGLRRYLQRGGFMWVDDFWGDAEWQQFANVMQDVLPGGSWKVIPVDHPIFHTVFDMDVMPQIPALPFALRGAGTAEWPGSHKYPAGSTDVAQLRGWFDAQGRLMVVATHNTDCGDGFEKEAYGDWYFETFSTKAYMLGVNIVTYAVTH